MSLQPQPATIADDLREALVELDDNVDRTAASVGYVFDLLDDPRATRLAARRIGRHNPDRGAGLDLEPLHTLRWVLDEGADQSKVLPEVLGLLLEPLHLGRYGRKYGIYVRTPLDWAKCGTPANYGAHRRRGQDACRACKKAVARYEADRRRHRKELAHNTIRIGESSCP
jgi:hypothetical protein